MYGEHCWEPAPRCGSVSPFQICARENNVILCTVYCSKFDCLGIIGYVLHKTISKNKAKMVGLSQSCQFTGLLLFNICNTFKLVFFFSVSLF